MPTTAWLDNPDEHRDKIRAYVYPKLDTAWYYVERGHGLRCQVCGKPGRAIIGNKGPYIDFPPKGQMFMETIVSPGAFAILQMGVACRYTGACAAVLKREVVDRAKKNVQANLRGTNPRNVTLDGFEEDAAEEDKSDLPLSVNCAQCEKDKGKLLRCGGCNATMYCGPECQKKNWSKHKDMCRSVKGVKIIDSDGTIKVLKENRGARIDLENLPFMIP